MVMLTCWVLGNSGRGHEGMSPSSRQKEHRALLRPLPNPRAGTYEEIFGKVTSAGALHRSTTAFEQCMVKEEK